MFDRLYKFVLSKLEELIITNLRISVSEIQGSGSLLQIPLRNLSNEDIAHVKTGVMSLADKMKFDF